MEDSYLLRDRNAVPNASGAIPNHQPPEAADETKTKEGEAPSGPSGRNRWTALSRLEKILIACLFIVLNTCIILVIILAVNSSSRWKGFGLSKLPSDNDLISGLSVDTKGTITPICEHEDCTVAAADIIQALDVSVDPCEDFERFSCGGWTKKNPAPGDSSKWSQFDILTRRLNIIYDMILQKSYDESKVPSMVKAQNFYKACLNETKLEDTGLKPLLNLLNDFGGWPMAQSDWQESNFDWLKVASKIRKKLEHSFIISVDVRTDMKNTKSKSIYFDQPIFGMPRPVLVSVDEHQARIAAYKTYIKAVVRLLSNKHPFDEDKLNEDVEEVYDFEVKLGNISTAEENRRDMNLLYNKMTVNDLISISENKTNWKNYLNTIFSLVDIKINGSTKVIVMEKNYVINMTKLIYNTEKRIVSNYMLWRVVQAMGDESTKALRDAATEYKKISLGIKEVEPRNLICTNKIIDQMGMAIGIEYTKTYFTKSTKSAADRMIENIRESFKELLAKNEWMDDVTKPLAEEKANVITKVLGYPDWYEKENGLEKYFQDLKNIEHDEHFQNILTLSEFKNRDCFKQLGEPVNRNKWFTTPVVVNAFYESVFNSITFPAAILQPPFYRSTAPQYLNYGGIGQVIGHEITHGFDDQGRQYNKEGNAVPWWSEETIEKFKQKAQCIVDQYQNFKIPELFTLNNKNVTVNGKITQGENIADNGGLRAAFLAYRNYVAKNGEEPRLPGLSMYSPEQLFFISNAQIWCSSSTKEGLHHQVLSDNHSPARFRILGPMSNMEEFARIWNCPAKTPMNPGNKCLVW